MMNCFLVLLILSSFCGWVHADKVGIVYCDDPIYGTLTMRGCDGGIMKYVGWFPESPRGYAAIGDDSHLVTSLWNSPFISVTSTTSVISTAGRIAVMLNLGDCPQVAACAGTTRDFLATDTYYTVYAPSAGITTITAPVTVVQTSSITSTFTSPVTVVQTRSITNTLTTPVTVVLTSTITSTDVSTVTEESVVTSSTTITDSVQFCPGSGNEVTIYTSGSVPGTSTVTVCHS